MLVQNVSRNVHFPLQLLKELFGECQLNIDNNFNRYNLNSMNRIKRFYFNIILHFHFYFFNFRDFLNSALKITS